MAKITLFSKNNCMQCKMTKKILGKGKVLISKKSTLMNSQKKSITLKASVSLLLQLLKPAISSFQVFNRLNLKKSFNYQVFI